MRFSNIFTRWKTHHQKKISEAFPFLKQPPSFKYNVRNKHVEIFLPPGANVYTTDPIFFLAMGFSTSQIDFFEDDEGVNLFGFQNRSMLAETIVATDERQPGESMSMLARYPRTQMAEYSYDPEVTHIIIALDRDLSFELSATIQMPLQRRNILQAVSLVASNLTEQLNLKNDMLHVTEVEEGIQLTANQSEDCDALLTLSPDEKTAKVLNATPIQLHFGADSPPTNSVTQVLFRSPPDASGSATTPTNPPQSSPPPSTSGSTLGIPALLGGAAQPQRVNLEQLGPMALYLPEQVGGAFVHGWGSSVPIAAFRTQFSGLTSYPVRLLPDQSFITCQLLLADQTAYTFTEELDLFLVLSVTASTP